MTEAEIIEKIKNLLTKFPDGITLSPVEIVTLYLLHIHKEESDENDFIDKEIVNIAIQRSMGYLSQFNCNIPIKTDTVMENLLKKGFLLYSATEKNAYYLSEISSSILNGLFSKDLETISDVESNLNTIYIALKNLENASINEIYGFFKHTFFDLIFKIDKKIMQIKEEILDIKAEIKASIRSGNEESFTHFLEYLEKIRNLLKEIATSLSKYSAYNQILYFMNILEKKCQNDGDTIDSIHKAYRKLFSIKNELENTLTDVTEFINRHVSLITSQISISSLDNILQFQKKLLLFFTKKKVLLRKPSRLRVKDFKYKWKTRPRKPVYIYTENIITHEEIDTFEKKEIEKIIEHLLMKLEKEGEIDYISEIIKFPLVESNLPKYYNKILFEISEKVSVILDSTEFKYENCYLSNIILKQKKGINDREQFRETHQGK
ncbi:hypothetical protein FHQ18_12130 [Deferribacter autotrophicus]|uniref:Uncharacterized protein n=1 Tax=Deferribacter autotrophicus TaxID=500465 RepID=A0A5A8F0M4_9BACT|nr:hypothetical protein [Deferribacter autotrophicus]KAA0256867.1 hypothetical protein FHQ18_12130 [Deferribacter autotrophicus]